MSSFSGTPVVGGGSWLAADNVRLLKASQPVVEAARFDSVYAAALGYAFGVADSAMLLLAGDAAAKEAANQWTPEHLRHAVVMAWQRWLESAKSDLAGTTRSRPDLASDCRQLEQWLTFVVRRGGTECSALNIMALAAITAVNNRFH